MTLGWYFPDIKSPSALDDTLDAEEIALKPELVALVGVETIRKLVFPPGMKGCTE